MLSFGFRIFCWYRGFCHRTGSDLLFFSCLGHSEPLSKFCAISFQECIKESFNRSLRMVKGATNFITFGFKMVKPLPHRLYDLAIIEMPIGLVIVFIAFYRFFLKRCTLTNKAVRTMLWTLSRPAPIDSRDSFNLEYMTGLVQTSSEIVVASDCKSGLLQSSRWAKHSLI